MKLDNEIKTFYRTLQGQHAEALEPDSPLYEPIWYEQPQKDPILQLASRIGFAESESVNILTGFRGNGKSTELRRLRKLLQGQDCSVVLIDMLKYLHMTKPLEISDFLLSLVAALAKTVRDEFGVDAIDNSAITRFWDFLHKTNITLDDATVKADAGLLSSSIGLKLHRDPDFKAQVQEKMRGHLDGLVEEVEVFVRQVVKSLQGDNPEHKVVLLVDSVEQLRGVGNDAQAVYDSVVAMLSGQAAHLHLPTLHVVYTVPPFTLPKAPNIANSLGGNPITVWPNIHVRTPQGKDDEHGLEVMRRIIERRYPDWQTFYQPQQLDNMARISGGDIRDFFRLVREGLLGLNTLRITGKTPHATQVEDAVIEAAIAQLRSEFLPIPQNDIEYLARIHDSKEHCLDEIEHLSSLMRFLDTNMVMNYLNGQPWCDIHPVLLKQVTARR